MIFSVLLCICSRFLLFDGFFDRVSNICEKSVNKTVKLCQLQFLDIIREKSVKKLFCTFIIFYSDSLD